MTTQKTVFNSEALLVALAQQSKPLPEDLQRSLQDAGQALRENQLQAASQLRELVRQDPLLESAYQNALEQWDEQYASQERTKNLSATFPNPSVLDSLFLQNVTPSQDWVTTAKQVTDQQSNQPTAANFWNKADRIVVMVAGGAAVGGAIGLAPGAIAGATVAAICGWYMGFEKKRLLNSERSLLKPLAPLAQNPDQTTESTVSEEVISYSEIQAIDNDPLIGLFSGSPDLATQSEDILQQSIDSTSGWTWKQ